MEEKRDLTLPKATKRSDEEREAAWEQWRKQAQVVNWDQQNPNRMAKKEETDQQERGA